MNQPNPPAYSMSPASDVYAAQHLGPPHWSALAITAFVLSFIGFLGLPAILGIILGIAGIIVTRGGRRRGMGLAIAAIPISLVTGAVCAFGVLGYVSFMKMNDLTKVVEKSLTSSEPTTTALDSFYSQCSPSFQQDVTKEQLSNWVGEVNRKHGTLVSVNRTITPDTLTSYGEQASFNLPGKFVNGPAMLEVRFDLRRVTQPLIENVEVDGLSPRNPKAGKAD